MVDIVAAILLGGFYSAAMSQTAPAECRTMTVRDPVGSHDAKYCRGPDGVWREQPKTLGGGGGAPAFRGRITYAGTYSGRIRPRQNAPRLDLRRLQQSLRTLASQAQRNGERRIDGAITITLDFDGAAVSGRYAGQASSIQGRLTGTIANGICRLTDDSTGAPFEGRCGMQAFAGEIRSAPDVNPDIQVRFDAVANATVDFDVRDRKAAAAAAAIREERRREAEAAARRLAALTQAAEAGDVEAMTSLAQMYDNGDGVARDYGQALRWYRLAADKGSPFALHNLGVMYWNGEGVTQSRPEGHRWFLRCAGAARNEIGNACAAIVAHNFDQGAGVVRDSAQSVRWYRVCAAADNEACIAWLNAKGIGMAPARPRRATRK